MSWRRIHALTLVLLGLLIASPLSSGDKGLWLSFAATPVQLLDLATDQVPTEHSILLPERVSRAGRTVTDTRPERTDVGKALGPGGSVWSFGSGQQWTVPVPAPPHPLDDLFADRPAPRAPPA